MNCLEIVAKIKRPTEIIVKEKWPFGKLCGSKTAHWNYCRKKRPSEIVTEVKLTLENIAREKRPTGIVAGGIQPLENIVGVKDSQRSSREINDPLKTLQE